MVYYVQGWKPEQLGYPVPCSPSPEKNNIEGENEGRATHRLKFPTDLPPIAFSVQWWTSLALLFTTVSPLMKVIIRLVKIYNNFRIEFSFLGLPDAVAFYPLTVKYEGYDDGPNRNPPGKLNNVKPAPGPDGDAATSRPRSALFPILVLLGLRRNMLTLGWK